MIVTTCRIVVLTGVWPVWKPEGEKLKTGGSEEQLPVLSAQVTVAGDLVAKLADHVNRGGEQVVELGDAGGLHRDQPVLGVKLFLLDLDILKMKTDFKSQVYFAPWFEDRVHELI